MEADMKQQPHVDLKRHHRLRAILIEHQNAVVTTVPRSALLSAAKRFGLAVGDRLLLETEGEMVILFDYLIYHHRQRDTTLVQKYLARLPETDDPDETLVRQAMGSPRFSMFEVEGAHSFIGVVVRDLVCGGSDFVVDQGLSTSVKPGRYMALRLLPLPEYWMTSGAGFPLSSEIVETIQDTFVPALRLTEGENLNLLSSKAGDELATVVTGAAINVGTTGDIKFQ